MSNFIFFFIYYEIFYLGLVVIVWKRKYVKVILYINKKILNRFILILFKLWWIVERKFVIYYIGCILIIK